MQDIQIGLKKSAVLCILRCQDKYLLLQRGKDPHKGEYIPVGGKIEPFEDPLSATAREVFEETGIKLDKKQLKFMGVLSESSPVKFNWINFVYYADIDFLAPPKCPEGELHWIEDECIDSIPMPQTDYFFFKMMKQNRSFMLNALYDEKINLTSLVEEIKNEVLV
jgi:8-oxo-dGTP diphosphatase